MNEQSPVFLQLFQSRNFTSKITGIRDADLPNNLTYRYIFTFMSYETGFRISFEEILEVVQMIVRLGNKLHQFGFGPKCALINF